MLHPPRSSSKGRWQGTQARIFGAAKDSTKDLVDWTAFSPVFVDVGRTDSLFSWCWCRVVQTSVDVDGLRFEADLGRVAPASREDLEILQRARTFFTDSTRWNRADTRDRAIVYCPKRPASRTLYCALYDATATTRGDGAYGGPAVGAIQAAIRVVSPRRYQHPLTDFNNDPLVGFTTFVQLFDEAIRRVREAIDSARGGA